MERLNIDSLLREVASCLNDIARVTSSSEINERYISIVVASNEIINRAEDTEAVTFITEQVMTRLEHICNYNLVRVAYDTFINCTDVYDARFKISMCKLSLKGDEDKYVDELYIIEELLNTLTHYGSKRNPNGRNRHN